MRNFGDQSIHKKNEVTLLKLLEMRNTHLKIRDFFGRKGESVLGNIYFLLPVFGIFNLIQTHKIISYHGQLHYDDLFTQFHAIRPE